ncbi:hypothetical protein FGB62_22g114 [Gracilaria domingensis]|nr:hypothetical protein FGB62_22g114 [Gracilaria domingensis]
MGEGGGKEGLRGMGEGGGFGGDEQRRTSGGAMAIRPWRFGHGGVRLGNGLHSMEAVERLTWHSPVGEWNWSGAERAGSGGVGGEGVKRRRRRTRGALAAQHV